MGTTVDFRIAVVIPKVAGCEVIVSFIVCHCDRGTIE
jgi:hypothetical protein